MDHSVFPPFPRKHPYYIVCPPYTRKSAGVRTMHVLSRAIRQNGYEAYLVSPRINHYLGTPALTNDILETHFDSCLTPITIYPETLFGNPLNSPYVVRYILNYPGLLGGPTVFDKKDMILYFAENMRPSESADQVLFLPVSDPTIFYPPPPGTQRSGSCFYAGKFKNVHGGEVLRMTAKGVEITRDEPDSQTPLEIADLFRCSEIFYCYENSALVIEAALCGCPAVMIPNSYLTQKIAAKEVGDDGVAWGTHPDEIERAKRTVSKVWDNYSKLFDRFSEGLKSFIDVSQTQASRHPYRQPMELRDPYLQLSRVTNRPKIMRLMRLVVMSLGSLRTFKELWQLLKIARVEGFGAFKRSFRQTETVLFLQKLAEKKARQKSPMTSPSA